VPAEDEVEALARAAADGAEPGELAARGGGVEDDVRRQRLLLLHDQARDDDHFLAPRMRGERRDELPVEQRDAAVAAVGVGAEEEESQCRMLNAECRMP
jgi:hypothetical protein